MELTIKINLDNAAFEGKRRRAAEVRRVLEQVTEGIADARTDGRCADVNGNTVGTWEITE